MTKLLFANFAAFLSVHAKIAEKKKICPRVLDNPVLQNASMILPKPYNSVNIAADLWRPL